MSTSIASTPPMIELVWFNESGEAQKSLVPLSLVTSQATAVATAAAAAATMPLSPGRAEDEVVPADLPPADLSPAGATATNGAHPTKLGTNVYVSRLPKTITQDQLEKLFQLFGPIISCRVVYHTQGKQGRVPRDPVGFVQFLSPDVAQTAIAQMNGMLYEGKRLVVRLADQDKDKGITSAPSDNLYIANLPKHFRESDLQAIFSPYGQILDLVVLKHLATGQSKGSGMVRFSSVEEASRAKDALNCARLPDLDYPLEVKFAESKDDKLMRQRQKLNAQQSDGRSQLSSSFTSEKQALSPSSASAPASPSPSVFSSSSFAAPTRPPTSSQTTVMSALEDYLKAVLPHPAPSATTPRSSSIWDRQCSELTDNLMESENWDMNTYGYSSDSNSDGLPATPSPKLATSSATPHHDLLRSALTPQRPAVSQPLRSASSSFSFPPPVSAPMSPICGPAAPPLSPGSGPLLPPAMPSPLPWASAASASAKAVRSLSPVPYAAVGGLQGNTQIRIANLPSGATQLHLYQLCARFGAILSCNLEKQEDGSCVAWLVFKKAEEAAQVELKLDGQILQGCKLQVQLY